MRKILITALAACLIMSTIPAFAGTHHEYRLFDGYQFGIDDVNFDIDHGNLIMTDDDDNEVVITDKYELLINGDKVELTAEQQQLVQEYYDTTIDIISRSTRIGMEGAKIGIEGAKLGLKAIAKVIKMLRADYDADDLEREMEAEADKLEARADELEDRADEVEKMADDLEDMFYDLNHQIPAMATLDWD